MLILHMTRLTSDDFRHFASKISLLQLSRAAIAPHAIILRLLVPQTLPPLPTSQSRCQAAPASFDEYYGQIYLRHTPARLPTAGRLHSRRRVGFST